MKKPSSSTRLGDAPPNLFRSLFDFRPRERTTSRENFLTEALVYAVRSSKPAARAWISAITDQSLRAHKITKIVTRISHRGEDNAIVFPDIRVEGEDHTGKPFLLIVEHKWDAPYSLNQLLRYSSLEKASQRHLALVCAKAWDHGEALKFQPPRRVSYHASKWEDVYAALKKIRPTTPMFAEFLDFMDGEGLSPGRPITLTVLKAATNEPRVNSTLVNQMTRYCEKLSNEYPWDIIPARYRGFRDVKNSSGRCVVVFSDEDDWRPGVSVGFHHSPRNQDLPLVDARKGADLLLRVHASPKTNPSPTRVLDLLRERVPSLRRLGTVVHLKDDPKNKNKHSLLFVQRSLVDVISGAKSEADQLNNIYDELSRWCGVLFEGSRPLVAAFAKLQPYALGAS